MPAAAAMSMLAHKSVKIARITAPGRPELWAAVADEDVANTRDSGIALAFGGGTIVLLDLVHVTALLSRAHSALAARGAPLIRSPKSDML